MARVPRFTTAELLARPQALVGGLAPGSVCMLQDADPQGIRLLTTRGLQPVVRVRGTEPGAVLDGLLHAVRHGAKALLEPAWGTRQVVEPTDHALSEVLYQALVHAERTQDRALRAALDARRGYRRLLAGAAPDPADPLDLRWDLTHDPQGTDRLTFLLTRNCQLRCRYCMVKLWDEDALDADQLAGLESLFRTDSATVRMQFYGGEPLLRPALFQTLVRRARVLERSTAKRLSIILITNGIAMTQEIAGFCASHRVEVLVSLDGPGDLHDARRLPHARPLADIPKAAPETSAAARRALGMLVDAGADIHVIVTVTPADVHRTAEALLAVRALGVPKGQICYAMGVEWGASATAQLCDQFELLAHELAADPAFDWVNLYRNEPILIDTALQLETDGRVCFMNECMFEKYKSDRNYGIAHVSDLPDLRTVGSTRFHNYAMLTAVYGDRKATYRDIMLDNIDVGHAVRDRLRRVIGTLPTAGET